MESTQGQPGERGKNAIGSIGGAGGAGGTGGHGDTTGGTGGTGGRGGRGETGATGPRGRGAPHRAIIGYLVLAIFVCIGFLRVEQINDKVEKQVVVSVQERKKQDKQQLEVIRTIMCTANRQVQTSGQRTPEEKAQYLANVNRLLASINASPCKM